MERFNCIIVSVVFDVICTIILVIQPSKLMKQVYLIQHPMILRSLKKMSSEFNKLYRSIIHHLRVDVSEVKDVLRYISKPHHLTQRYVHPSVYQDATSTKDLLDQLYPDYINPEDTFLLEEIVAYCGSCPECETLLEGFTSKFHLCSCTVCS